MPLPHFRVTWINTEDWPYDTCIGLPSLGYFRHLLPPLERSPLMPEAARQFDMLKAEVEGVNGKDKGPALIAEALNLLFAKYGKPQVA